MALIAPVLLWAVAGVASAAPAMISDAVHQDATHCGWRLGTAATRVNLPVEVYGAGLKRCSIDLAQFAPAPPFNTKTTRVDATALTLGANPSNESVASNHRYVRVTATATTLRYDIIQSTACTKAEPIVCFPF